MVYIDANDSVVKSNVFLEIVIMPNDYEEIVCLSCNERDCDHADKLVLG